MKKISNVILICALLFLIGLFIRPEKVVYAPKITGQVIDVNGNPIQDAIVSRIEENEMDEVFKSQVVRTNSSRNFELPEKAKIEWLHTPLDLPFVWCYANFEVSKNGYKSYKTGYNLEENSTFNENQNGCKDIEFNPRITLEKL